jgi:hypothetical protein
MDKPLQDGPEKLTEELATLERAHSPGRRRQRLPSLPPARRRPGKYLISSKIHRYHTVEGSL